MSLPVVELVTHDRGTIELTEWVNAVAWANSVHQPWHSVSVSLHLPRRDWAAAMPYMGDWLVVRDGRTREALAWGYVVSRSTGISVQLNETIATDPVVVRAVGWFDFLGLVQVYAVPGFGIHRSRLEIEKRAKGKTHQGVGTLMTSQEWAEGPWRAILQTIQSRVKDIAGDPFRTDTGRALVETLKELPRVLLPPNIGGEFLTQAVRAVHDATSAQAYAPERTMDAVPGPSLAGMGVGGTVNGNSVLSLITSTFVSDPSLIELFPSMEPPGTPGITGDPRDLVEQTAIIDKARDEAIEFHKNLEVLSPRFMQLAAQIADTTVKGLLTQRLRAFAEQVRVLRHEAHHTSPKLASATGRALGLNPVLMYRMTPWRSKELTRWGTMRDPNIKGRFVQRYVTNIERSDVNPTLLPGNPWGNLTTVKLPTDQVISIDFTASDADHVNAVRIGLPWQPDHPIGMASARKLPLFAAGDITRRGCRMMTPSWSFFPPWAADAEVSVANPGLGAAKVASLHRDTLTIALHTAQMMMSADRFESGSIRAGYSPDVRHGELVSVDLPGDLGRLTAYVEAVEHSVTVAADGAITKRSTISYSRGLLNEDARSVVTKRRGVGGT
jgi:hypothetical protein